MVDTNIFLGLAQIASTYIGFGSLVTVVTRRSNTAYVWFQTFIATAVLVIICSLPPFMLMSFNLKGDKLWELCCVLFLILDWSSLTLCAYIAQRRHKMLFVVIGTPVKRSIFWLIEICVQTALWLVILNVVTVYLDSFYLIALVLVLIQATQLFVQLIASFKKQH